MLWKRGCVLGLQVCGLGLGLGLAGCGLVNITGEGHLFSTDTGLDLKRHINPVKKLLTWSRGERVDVLIPTQVSVGK